MRRLVPLSILLAALGTVAARADGEGPSWPVGFDAEARRVFTAWEAREYNVGRVAEGPFEAEVEITALAPTPRELARGTYRFHMGESELPLRPGSQPGLERGFWRTLLDVHFRALGWRVFLRDAEVVAVPEGNGTTLRVGGERPLRALSFDASGRLRGVTMAAPDESGALVTQDLRTTYASHEGKDVLTRTRGQRVVPGLGPAVEEADLVHERTGGLLLPARIDYRLTGARVYVHLRVSLARWRVGDAASVEMEPPARWLLEDWERRVHEAGRFGLRSASCRFEMAGPRGAPLARGAYRWDGRLGHVTWDEGRMAQAYGQIPWPVELARALAPYAPRTEFAWGALRLREEEGRRVLEGAWSAGPPGRGLLSLAFDGSGRWTGGTVVDDDGAEGTLAVRHEAFRHGGEDLERLIAWTETYGGVVRRRVTLGYGWAGGFALPSTLRREASQGGETRGCTVRFLDWQVEGEAPLRIPP